jgi:hypothetical protein
LEVYRGNSLDAIAMFGMNLETGWDGQLLGKICGILSKRVDLFPEAFHSGR